MARNRSSRFTGYFYVIVRPRPSPSIIFVGATPQQLGPFGGVTTVTGSVKNAKTCRLELLSQQGFPVDYASNLRPCTDHFAARVVIGANTSAAHRTITFALVVSDGPSSFTGPFYVGMAGSSRPAAPSATTTVASAVTTTTAAPTTTTAVATTTRPLSATTTVASSGVQHESSDNWSGYAVTGGPSPAPAPPLPCPLLPRRPAVARTSRSGWGSTGSTPQDSPPIASSSRRALTRATLTPPPTNARPERTGPGRGGKCCPLPSSCPRIGRGRRSAPVTR